MYRLAHVLFLAFLSSFSAFSAHAQSTDPPRSVVFAPNYRSLPENLPTSPLRLALNRERDPWLGFDKVQHVTFSFLGTLSNQYVLVNKLDVAESHALPVSIAVTATLGLGKEVYDKKRGPRRHFSYRDLLADAVGIGLATVLIAF